MEELGWETKAIGGAELQKGDVSPGYQAGIGSSSAGDWWDQIAIENSHFGDTLAL